MGCGKVCVCVCVWGGGGYITVFFRLLADMGGYEMCQRIKVLEKPWKVLVGKTGFPVAIQVEIGSVLELNYLLINAA